MAASNFAGADLREAQFERARLDQADFSGANLARAGFIESVGRQCCFDGADLTATVFRNRERSSWSGSSFQTPRMYRRQWLGKHPKLNWQGCQWPESETVAAAYSPTHPPLSPHPVALSWLADHSNGVNACAFSPDGLQIISASDDGTLLRWDVASSCQIQSVIRPGGLAWAIIDEVAQKVLFCGPDAWRYIGWTGLDERGKLRRYPAELKGWLPEVVG